MNQNDFKKLTALLKADLSGEQAIQLEYLFKEIIARNFLSLLFTKRTEHLNQNRKCPHCNGINIVKHGYDKNHRQRYKCRNCNKTYNILTNTGLARARKPGKWMDYLNHMKYHITIRDMRYCIGIAHNTAFRWRHRFLGIIAGNTDDILSGIIEVDEAFFNENFKGHKGWALEELMRKGRVKKFIPIPVDRKAYKRAGAEKRGVSKSKIPVMTALDNKDVIYQTLLRNRHQVVSALAGRFKEGSLVCSDGLKGYQTAAQAAGVEHRVIEPKRGFSDSPINRGAIGLGHVNSYHNQAKKLIDDKCCGVATKYLDNYMAWVRGMKHNLTGQVVLKRALN